MYSSLCNYLRLRTGVDFSPHSIDPGLPRVEKHSRKYLEKAVRLAQNRVK